MIRHLHPTDSPALLRFKQKAGPDEVRSLSRAVAGGGKGFPLVKYTTIALSPRAWQSCWVKTRRASVQAVLRAGQRSGPLAWELSELYVTRTDDGVLLEVLDQLAFPAGTSGARRIFLRLPSESHIFNAARSAGYEPVCTETLYSLEPALNSRLHSSEGAADGGMKLLDEADEHALYRLFCAAVPIGVRTKIGQTFDEWRSASEKPGRKRRDWGLEDGKSTGLQAHVSAAGVSGGTLISMMSRDLNESALKELVAAAVGVVVGDRLFTMVPSYQQNMGPALTDIGFTQHETYDVMVKTLVVPVGETVPGMVAIER